MTYQNHNSLSIAHVLFIAAAFTASFDVFLAVNLGFNFRITQLLLLLPIGIAIIQAIQNRLILPMGFNWLVLWTMFIVAFVPNSQFLPRSMGYSAWLMLNVLAVFTCVQIFSTPGRILTLVRWYIYSFVFVAAFGLVQFISPIAGLGETFLITQWWFPGVLPRINGFSSEPSFFSTYLLMGWVTCVYFLESRVVLIARKHLWVHFSVISLALILSSSRMGILMMILWYCQYPLRLIARLTHGYVNRRLLGISSIFVSVMLLILGLVIYVVGLDSILFLFSGLGILGSESSHSVDVRENSTMDTLELFMSSPILGYSLGGVAPAIAQLHGVMDIDFEIVKQYEGNSVFVEVLAASGFFGFIPFAIFIFLIIEKPLRLARRLSVERTAILTGLTLALIFELAVLQFNQNILRPYLWMHIAVLAACYSVFKRYDKATDVTESRASVIVV